MDASPGRPSLVLRRLINGYQVTQAIHVAAKLGLADLMASGPQAADGLAAATGAHPDSLARLLRALATAGVFHEEDDGRFGLTELGECLRSDAPEPVGAWAAFVGEPYHWQAWGDLLHGVQTGEMPFRNVHGSDPWTFRAAHPELSAGFDRAMADISRQASAAVLAAFDFGRFGVVADIGGGTGVFLAAILAKHPATRGILFDQPHVVSGAARVLTAAGVADRCQVVGGSFFDAVPEGGDAYVLKAVLHDAHDDDALAILRVCRRAMRPGTRLLAIERELGAPNESPDAKFSDLNMLVATGGRERRPEEYAALFAATGFDYAGFTPSTIGIGVFEAIARP
jgi:hypothetical protein